MGLILTEADVKQTAAPAQNKVTEPSRVEAKPAGKLSNWDSEIAPIIDKYPQIKEVVNYNNSKHIMRAVNGRYDKAMSELKNDDPKAYESFKKFKNSSIAAANELKKIDSGQFNPKLFDKYQKDATVYFNSIADAYDYEKGKRFAMNPEGKFMSREEYDKWDQTPKVSKDKASTTARVVYNNEMFENLVADYETPNVSSAYKKLKNIDAYYKDKGLELIQPITKSWVATSLQRIDTKHPNADSDTAALNMNMDILSHVAKYKTTLDPELAKSDQASANNILKQLKGKDRSEQLQLLKSYSEKINNISGRMGYYGNASIYNKYKNGHIGKTLDYYPQSKDKNRSDYFNQTQENGTIDRTINNFKEFRGVNEKIRLQTLDRVNNNWKAVSDGLGLDLKKSQFNVAMNELIDEKGNISSYETWKKNLRKIDDPANYGYTPGGNPRIGVGSTFKNTQEKGLKRMSALGQIWEQNKTVDWSDPALYGWTMLTGGIGYATNYQHNKEGVEEDLISIYNGLKKAYKKNFDNVKAKQVYDGTLMDAGFGSERNQAMEYRGVNLSADRNMRLKATEGPKQENVNKVFSLLFDTNGNVDKENVTVFSNADIKSGLNAVQKSDLADYKKNNEKVLKDFLKKDNDNVTMTFYRNTNVSGQSAYQFYNPKTKESMMVYAPKEMLGNKGIKEDLFTKTGRDPLDFTFKAKGELAMPLLNDKQGKPAYKSAALKYDKENDSYIGEIWDYNSEGKLKRKVYEIPYGSAISVNDAQRNFLDLLNQYKNSK